MAFQRPADAHRKTESIANGKFVSIRHPIKSDDWQRSPPQFLFPYTLCQVIKRLFVVEPAEMQDERRHPHVITLSG